MITTQRSYADFILKCRAELPALLEFEGIGILFRDGDSSNLFNVELNFTEPEIMQLKEFENKKMKGIPLTDQERIENFERQMKKQVRHIYPTNLGVTGEVF